MVSICYLIFTMLDEEITNVFRVVDASSEFVELRMIVDTSAKVALHWVVSTART